MCLKSRSLLVVFILSSLYLFAQEVKAPPNWLDLPQSSTLYSMPLSCEVLDTLVKQVDTYHAIKKDERTLLHTRIKSLSKISETIQLCLEKFPQNAPPLHLIHKIVLSKLSYLKKLAEIFEDNLEDKLEEYHTSIETISSEYAPLFLRNERLFSLRMKEYWGDFWWETLDPCHRRLSPYISHWEEIQSKDNSTPPFFLWLETQHIPQNFPRTTYFSDEEAENYHYIFLNGLICHAKTLQPIDCSESERYIFSIPLNKKLYIAKSTESIFHSSFNQGKALLAAGVLSASNGRLNYFSIESGHYFPTPQNGFQALNIFRDIGMTFPPKLTLSYYSNSKKYRLQIDEKAISSYETFISLIEESKNVQEISNCEF
tara:strand:+ start:5823 stop:6935 length:1113 start_codon:yes stop_codon:yes gene_type:complete